MKTKARRNPFAARIERLRAEIANLTADLYNTADADPHLSLLNLKTFRVELLRGFVLYMHLAFEDLLKRLIALYVQEQSRYVSVKEIGRHVFDMRSWEVVGWCGRLNLISKNQYQHLLQLNSMRNRCVHRWILDEPRVRKIVTGSATRRVREPTVRYHNKDLFNSEVFLQEFCPTYGKMYVSLLGKVWRLEGRI
jgi:hypothetical protein